MTITIIGGSGFVGTRLAKRLVDAGHAVKIVDKRISRAFPELWTRSDVRNAPNENAEFPESATDALTAPGVAEESAKAQKMQTLLDALKASDVVVNLAAEHRDDVTPKTLYDEVNVEGAKNVCDACAALGIKEIIFTSSVAVYGFAPEGTDENGEINYFNDYGRTKFEAEKIYSDWAKDARNSLTIIRPTVIFGEGNRGNVYNLLRQIAGGRFPMVGDGKNRKSINYVENVAAFIQFCAENDVKQFSELTNISLFNYCDTPAYDMNTLVKTVYKALGKEKKSIFHFPYWLGIFGGKCFDALAKVTGKKFAVSSIRVKKFCQSTYFTSSEVSKTGFVAPVTLEEGLMRTIEKEFLAINA